jgi:WD40 repeat protein
MQRRPSPHLLYEQPISVAPSASAEAISAQLVKITPTLIIRGHASLVFCVAFSPDGRRIVSGSADNIARVWDAHTGNPVTGPLVGHSDQVMAVTFSPHGTMVVSASRDATIWMWDAETGDKIRCLRGHNGWVWCVAFSPDNTRIASGSSDQTIRIWDSSTGNTIAEPFTGHTEAVRSVSFSPHGNRVISGSFDKTIRVWDVQEGKLVLGPLEGHATRVSFVAFSLNRMWLVSASGDRKICVWNAGTGKLVSGPSERLPKYPGYPVRLKSIDGRGITISPDGAWVVTHSQLEPAKGVQVWNSETGVLEGVFNGHTDTIYAVALSPDGRRIISCSDDKTIRVCTLDW